MLLGRALRRQGTVVLALVAAAVVATASPASAADATTLNFDCQAQAPVIGPLKTSVAQPVTFTAPKTVASGEEFDIVIAPGPTMVPSTVSGVQIKQIRDGKLFVPIPEGVEYEGADLSGGDNIAAQPTIERQGDKAVVSFAGPIKGGDTFTLPTVTAHLKATGEPGQKVDGKLGGTGFDNPDLTFTSTGTVFGVDVDAPTTCYANPSPTLGSITIE